MAGKRDNLLRVAHLCYDVSSTEPWTAGCGHKRAPFLLVLTSLAANVRQSQIWDIGADKDALCKDVKMFSFSGLLVRVRFF